MAKNVLICERCGRFYSHSNITDIGSDGKEHYITGAAVVMSGRYAYQKKELCPVCLRQFLDWYQGPGELSMDAETEEKSDA